MNTSKQTQKKITIPTLLNSVIPEEANNYQCTLTCESLPGFEDSNYKRIAKWRERTIKNIERYLKDNHLEHFISDDKHIVLFANYLFGIHLKLLDSIFNSQQSDGDKIQGYIFSYFINRHLKHSDNVDNPHPRNKRVISTTEMAYFFDLFLEINCCYAKEYYQLSAKKEELIRNLKSKALLPSESFKELITIFFQED